MDTKIISVNQPDGNEYFKDCNGLFKQGHKIEGKPLVFASWYGDGGYEGTGHAIYQCADGKWDHTPLGHCSCYGPLEGGCGPNGVYETLAALIATFSQELKKQTQGLIDALTEAGYK